MAPQSAPPIVGIGASAGGVEALQNFFAALPPDTDAAFVVVVHLDPAQRSELPSILANSTAMPVAAVDKPTKLLKNHVYVITPNSRLVITDHTISALPFDGPRYQRAPIDFFFRSLAEQHSDGHAYAVVLTGAGADGAIGVKSIKAVDGIVLVQDPNDAAFPSMPRSAIAAGVPDFVLPIRELAQQLADLLRRGGPGALPVQDDEEMLRRILSHLRVRIGHDFSAYKRATILRRLARRLQVTRSESLSHYYAYLRDNPEESQALFRDLLISVTAFFRDPTAFDILSREVIPRLFDGKETGGSIRVWVPGCATGEEAYTIGMLLLEEAARREGRPEIQVFGSDLDSAALSVAREGRYLATIEADVSEDRLRRFFQREGDHYRVRSELRDIVLFANHSLLRDPPFSRQDMISCRNLLIYLDRELQHQVCNTFQYALDAGGFLFLGASEGAEHPGGLFRPIDREARIYRSSATGSEGRSALPILLGPRQLPTLDAAAYRPSAAPSASDAAIHRQMLEKVAPPSMLVDEHYRAVHLSENAGHFLHLSGGPISTEATDMVREELRFDLRAALHRAFERGESTLSMPLPVQFNGSKHQVYLQVKPVVQDKDPVRFAHVLFIEGEIVEEGAAESQVARADESPAGRTVRQLQQELQLTQSRLRAMREESEAANEELRAANEELQSINEEYRSTSEELETSKEELQSINEELQTVNNELKLKLESVSRAHSDLQNLMAATDFGTLFLDQNLRIKRFTPRLMDLFNVTANDEGRPITDFTHQLDYDALADHARAVLKDLVPVQHEVESRRGAWYSVRIRPYRTVDDKIDGVVATFVDITERRRTEEALRESELRFRGFAEASPGALWMRDATTRSLEYASPVIATMYGVAPDALLGDIRHWAAAIVPEDREHALAEIDRVRNGQSVTHEFRIQRASDKAFRWIRNTGFPLRNGQGDVVRIGGIFEDVTETKLTIDHQNVLLAELQHRVRNIMAIVRSIAARTAETAGSVEEYATLLSGRLLTLSRVQGLLTRGANVGVGLDTLVRNELEAHTDREDQFDASGPEIVLSPKAAEVLTLAVHELTANALKYGALSTPSGLVKIRWATIDKAGVPWLSFDWSEMGGPVLKPTVGLRRRGFGTELIEQRIPYELGGRGEVTIDAGGARCLLEFPLEDSASILKTDAPRRPAVFGGALEADSQADLAGHRILVLEDDYYLANDAARIIGASGAEILGPYSSEEAALAAFEDATATGAVIDINLGDGPSFTIARKLRESGIPIIFITGYDRNIVPAEFAGVPQLQKPVELRKVVGVLAKAVGIDGAS